ncbi:MAG: hypothetical protein ABWW65_00350 [Thermoprotei archaeon]
MKAVSNVYALFLIVVVISALVVNYMISLERIHTSFAESLKTESKHLSEKYDSPILLLDYANNTLYLVARPVKPIEVKYLFIEYANGTTIFKRIDKTIYNDTVFTAIEEYDGTPVRIGLITGSGAVIYYSPYRDPRLQVLIKDYPLLINNTYIDNAITQIIESNSINEFYNPVTGNISRVVELEGNIAYSYRALNDPVYVNLTIQRLAPATVRIYSPIQNTLQVATSVKPGVYKLFDMYIDNVKVEVYYVIYFEKYGWDGAIASAGLLFRPEAPIVFQGYAQVYFKKEKILDQTVNSLDAEKNGCPLVLAPVSNFTAKITARHRIEYLYGNPHYVLYLEGYSEGSFITPSILLLHYNYYAEYGAETTPDGRLLGYYVGPYTTIEVNITITGYAVINNAIEPAGIPAPTQFYYSKTTYIKIVPVNTISRVIMSAWKYSYNYTDLKIIIPLGSNASVEKYIEKENTYYYAIAPQNYIEVKPVIPVSRIQPPLLNRLTISFGKPYSCSGGYTCRDYFVKTISGLTTMSIQLPRTLVLRDPHTNTYIENYVSIKPRNIQVEFKQGSISTYASTTYIQLYSGIPFKVYNPLNTTLELYVYRVENGVIPFNIYGSDYVAKYDLLPGENTITLNTEPGLYVFTIIIQNQDEAEDTIEQPIYAESVIVVII